MTLELLHLPPHRPSTRAPLLFVHGAWHGAWCWETYFMPYFSGRGFDCYAVSLRGHGGSPGRERIRTYTIAEYVSDVAEASAQIAEQTGRRPVIIGHSMGGFITQKALETVAAPAGVLLAPIPSHGFLPALLRLIERHPALIFRVLTRANPYGLIGAPALARHFLLWPDITPATLAALYERLQQESFRMLFDITLLDLPAPRHVRAPVLVLGGGNDALFTVPEFEATARAYGSQAVIFDNMAHGLMVEPGWENVADTLADWLDAQGV